MSAEPQTLRVIITDDEAPARSRLRELLQDCSESLPLEVVGEAANGRELLEHLEEQDADVVLLDIRMPEMDGLEAARHMQKLAESPKIIFTTAYDAHAVQAFELHAVDYLMKPIRGRRLLDALLRVRSMLPLRPEVLKEIAPEPRSYLSVQERGRIVLIPVSEILYLRAELKYVSIRTREKEHLLEESLTRLEQEFASRFIRIHRSYLVATAHLAGFEKTGNETGGEGKWEAVFKNFDERLPVSRRQAHVVREFGKSP